MAKKPGKLFTAPRVLPKVIADLVQEVADAFLSVEGAFAELFGKVDEPSRTTSRQIDGAAIVAQPGDIIQIVPPAAGTPVLLTSATTDTLGKVIILVVEGSAGSVTVSSTGGTVQGAASVTLTGVGVRTFESDGLGGWWGSFIGTGGGVPPAGAQGWDDVLLVDPTSGASNPIVSVGQFMQLGLAGPAAGQLRSGDAIFRLSAGAAFQTVAVTTVQIQGGGAVSLVSTGSTATVQGNGATAFTSVASSVTVTAATAVAMLAGTDAQIAAASGFNLRAGSSTPLAADDGDGMINATGGFGVRTGTGTIGTVTGVTGNNAELAILGDLVVSTGNPQVERWRTTSTGEHTLAGDPGAAGEVYTSQGPGLPSIWAAGGGGGVSEAYVKTIASYRSV